MVITRSHSDRNNRTKQVEMETSSDNESRNASFPDLLSGNHFTVSNEEAIRIQERDHERIRIEQKFVDMSH